MARARDSGEIVWRPRGGSHRSLAARAAEGGELTPVMARLGRVDLEILDALITAGIASSRAVAFQAEPGPDPEYRAGLPAPALSFPGDIKTAAR